MKEFQKSYHVNKNVRPAAYEPVQKHEVNPPVYRGDLIMSQILFIIGWHG